MSKINALIKGPREFLVPLPCKDTGKTAAHEPGRGLSPDTASVHALILLPEL